MNERVNEEGDSDTVDGVGVLYSTGRSNEAVADWHSGTERWVHGQGRGHSEDHRTGGEVRDNLIIVILMSVVGAGFMWGMNDPTAGSIWSVGAILVIVLGEK